MNRSQRPSYPIKTARARRIATLLCLLTLISLQARAGVSDTAPPPAVSADSAGAQPHGGPVERFADRAPVGLQASSVTSIASYLVLAAGPSRAFIAAPGRRSRAVNAGRVQGVYRLPGFAAGASEAVEPAFPPLALAARDSLPDRMPLRTRLLWGERGLMRGLGLDPDTRAGELRLRRSMLQWHQRVGLVTLGALTTQVVLGELIASDRVKFSGLKPYHRNGAYVTFGLYMTSASLSLFAPPGRRYSSGFSSIKLHRWLALAHFSGMVAQPLLGRSLVAANSPQQYDDRLQTHLWVGRLTLASFGAAILSTFLAY